MTSDDRRAFPHSQYNGSEEGFEEYETDKDAWLIDKGYETHVNSVDPRSIPRVSADESEEEYERRCKKFDDNDKKIWVKAIRGYTGAARRTALLAPKYKAAALFAQIKAAHGDKSDKQVTRLVREFTGRAKDHSKTIDAFNQEWTDSVRIMRANVQDTGCSSCSDTCSRMHSDKSHEASC